MKLLSYVLCLSILCMSNGSMTIDQITNQANKAVEQINSLMNSLINDLTDANVQQQIRTKLTETRDTLKSKLPTDASIEQAINNANKAILQLEALKNTIIKDITDSKLKQQIDAKLGEMKQTLNVVTSSSPVIAHMSTQVNRAVEQINGLMNSVISNLTDPKMQQQISMELNQMKETLRTKMPENVSIDKAMVQLDSLKNTVMKDMSNSKVKQQIDTRLAEMKKTLSAAMISNPIIQNMMTKRTPHEHHEHHDHQHHEHEMNQMNLRKTRMSSMESLMNSLMQNLRDEQEQMKKNLREARDTLGDMLKYKYGCKCREMQCNCCIETVSKQLQNKEKKACLKLGYSSVGNQRLTVNVVKHVSTIAGQKPHPVTVLSKTIQMRETMTETNEKDPDLCLVNEGKRHCIVLTDLNVEKHALTGCAHSITSLVTENPNTRSPSSITKRNLRGRRSVGTETVRRKFGCFQMREGGVFSQSSVTIVQGSTLPNQQVKNPKIKINMKIEDKTNESPESDESL